MRLRKWKHIVTYGKRKVIKKCDMFDIVSYKFNFPFFNNAKILFLSDLHIQTVNFNGNEIVKEINNTNSDWIIFGGDLLSFLFCYNIAGDFLKKLKAVKGKLAVLGNWEHRRTLWIPVSSWSEYFNNSGFTLLANNELYDENITFTGLIPDFYDYSLINSNIPEDKLSCLIVHKPDDAVRFLKTAKSKFNIVLCGHTHGGQIRIPGFGALATSSESWKLFEYGKYQNTEINTEMIVSSGLGYTCLKMRLFCRPELVLIEFI